LRFEECAVEVTGTGDVDSAQIVGEVRRGTDCEVEQAVGTKFAVFERLTALGAGLVGHGILEGKGYPLYYYDEFLTRRLQEKWVTVHDF